MLTPNTPRYSAELPAAPGTIFTTNLMSKEEMAQIVTEAKTANVDVQTYFAQPDEDILAQIRDQSVPENILLDKVGWKLLCTVRGLQMEEVSGDQWSDICERRISLTY